MTWTKDRLIQFEHRVRNAFLDRRVKSPVHLSGGNEDQLIEIFRDVRPGDWVFSGWRSHFHALLKGLPEEWVFNEILEGRSMYLMSKDHRFFCSSIVGGILPIACGVAMGIKREQEDKDGFCRRCGFPADKPDKCRCEKSQVLVFAGDMTARTGLFHEFYNFVAGHALPVKMVVEDNGFSTNSPTKLVWGMASRAANIRYYEYQRTYPHVGIGQFVQF